MKASELRIGNYFKCHDIQSIVHGIIDAELNNEPIIMIKFDKGFTGFKESEIEPIPLTEKWLADFGFIQTEEMIKLFGKSNYGNGKCSVLFIDNEIVMIHQQLRYVHEFQNWYYWNYNKEELTLKHG